MARADWKRSLSARAFFIFGNSHTVRQAPDSVLSLFNELYPETCVNYPLSLDIRWSILL